MFDPHASPTSKRRVRWQVFRRVAKRGLVRVDVSQGDRVRSKVLRAWLRSVGEGDAVRIRVAEGEQGDALYPTEAEVERAEKEIERAARQAAEAARDIAEAAREAAESEAARLRAVIEELKRSQR